MPRATRTRRVLLVMLGAAAASAAALPIVATAGPGGTQYPDLRSDRPEQPYTEVYSNADLGVRDRLLLRFWGFVVNVGEGPLDVAGNPAADTVRQRARTSSGGWTEVGDPPVVYESADGHDHFHLKNATSYWLRTPSGAPVAPGQKTGFCLYDSNEVRFDGTPAPQFYVDEPGNRVIDFCSQGEPDATWLRMGTSSGWRDDYNPTLAFQWVDISNVAPGTYRLESEADPDGRINEGGGSREVNPPNGYTEVVVPGYLAQNVSASHDGGPVTVRLQATGYGSAGALRFKVVEGPSRGTINRAVGEVFSDPNVVYTPGAGGPDAFRYVALNAVSGGAEGAAGQFPLSPPQATASIVDTGVSVAIGGAPAMLYAGTAAALSATVANAGPGVTWSVDGVPGGSPAWGTVTADGVYTAPAAPPPGGLVRVRATSVDDPSAWDEVAIRIEPAPARTPALSPLPPQATASGARAGAKGSRRPLSRPTVRRQGRLVIASVLPRKAGRVAITGVAGRRRFLRTCVVRTHAGRVVTCRMRLATGVRPRQVRIIAVLRAADGTRASTRARLVRPRPRR